MVGALLEVHFYDTADQAESEGRQLAAERKFNGGTDCKIRVLQMVSLTDWTCRVEWSALAAGKRPQEPSDVPRGRYVYVRGGTICEVAFPVWDAGDGGSVVLGLRVVRRT